MTMQKKAMSGKESLLFSSVKGASYLILLQLSSRLLTFMLHQIVLRYTTAETLGIASVKLELLLSTILFISREGFRCALSRGMSGEAKDTSVLAQKARQDSSATTPLSDQTPEGAEQKVTNLAYIPTVIGLVTTTLACGYYLWAIDGVTAAKYPHYRLSVALFGASALAELLVEPLFVLALNRLYFQTRVSIEGTAVLLRCLITFALTLLGNSHGGPNTVGILAFAIAQFVFGLTMALGYVIFFRKQVRQGKIQTKSLFPRKLLSQDGRTYYFDGPLLGLATTLTKQSLLKHVLTEGDKMLISVLSSDADQGVYAFVVNYGSLVARILFQPLEETGRTFFSKLMSGSAASSASDAKSTAVDVLLLILRLHVLLGLVFVCFASNYTATLIDLLAGKAWSVGSNAASVLAVYCAYVPIMGVNGITESFVQAVASKSDLATLSYYMVGFSLCFMGAGITLMHGLGLGAFGLVLANMVNLSIRIAYSWHFIVNYFGHEPKLQIRHWFPSKVTCGAFASAWLLTRWSEHTLGWHTLHQKIMHIGVGGVSAGLVGLVLLWKERDLLESMQQLQRRSKTD